MMPGSDQFDAGRFLVGGGTVTTHKASGSIGARWTLVVVAFLVVSACTSAEDVAPSRSTREVDPAPLIAFSSDPDGVTSYGTNGPEGVADIHSMHLDGSNRIQLTDTGAYESEPVWSPDGTRIAFRSMRDGDPEIYVMNADGSGQTNLTQTPGEDRNPTWSPDGRQIAWTALRNGTFDLWVMNADGSDPRPLMQDAEGDNAPAWSADGERIVFSTARRSESEWDLYSIAPDGSDLQPFTATDGADFSPEWSPSGDGVVFSSFTDNFLQSDIYITSDDGSETRPMARTRSSEERPTWAPDGSRIYFGVSPQGSEDVNFQLASTTTDANSRVTPVTDETASNTSPDLRAALSPEAEAALRRRIATASPAPRIDQPERAEEEQPRVMFSDGGAIATETPQSGSVGTAILDAGGNAVDAAVAATFAVGVTRPDLCGIGGGGFALVRTADGRVAALDFRETAPEAINPHAFEGPGIFREHSGHKTIGVPGTVAGLAALMDRFGTKELGDVIEPAVDLARDGFPVSAGLTESMTLNAARLLRFPEAASIYLRDGQPYGPGDRLVQPDYARSLELIADQGGEAFYEGEIADAIIRDMEQAGRFPGDEGLMTLGDLDSYEVRWREPIRTDYRGHEILAVPPPASGGLVVTQVLNLLERLPRARRLSADELHLFAEAQKIGWSDRDTYVADPEFVRVPTEQIASARYASQRAEEITLDRAAEYLPGRFPGYRRLPPGRFTTTTSHTAHISAIDAEGNAATVTCTIENFFGSAVVPEGAGFLLNNQLTDFTDPGTANEAQGGKRPRSSAAPVIVVRDGAPVLVLGGAGGVHIPMGVVTAITRLVDHDLAIPRALDAPRLDEPYCCTMGLEASRVPGRVLQALRRRGHRIEDRGDYFLFPVIQAVGIDGEGRRFAASDPRGEWGSSGQR